MSRADDFIRTRGRRPHVERAALHHRVNRAPFAIGSIVFPSGDEPDVHPDQMHLPF
jgi:hypothetical protein